MATEKVFRSYIHVLICRKLLFSFRKKIMYRKFTVKEVSTNYLHAKQGKIKINKAVLRVTTGGYADSK